MNNIFSLPFMKYLVPAATVLLIVALGAYTQFTFKQARYFYSGPVIINVVGEGEAIAVPDIATFTFSVRKEAADATTAQSQSAEIANAITEYLEEAGIEERDVKTLYYNLNPRYEYPQRICAAGSYCPPGERTLVGYEVHQTMQVKVRDTDQAGTLISGVGERGATDVSGLQFTIDDEESIKAEAREKAIADAKEKAKKLADDLGVRVVRMTGFWEDQGAYPYGYGGDVRMESAMMSMDGGGVAPSLPVGENTTTVRVNVSYEVK